MGNLLFVKREITGRYENGILSWCQVRRASDLGTPPSLV